MAVTIPSREMNLRTAIRLIVPVLYLCLFFDLFAGFFLGVSFDKIMEQYPHILIILPGLMGLRGNVFGAFCSRLSTAFYLGSSEPSFRDKFVYKNALFSIWAATLPVFVLLLISYLKIDDFDGFVASAQISIVSGFLIGLLLSLVSVVVVIFAFKKAIDPDSISGPLITSVADLVTIPSLVLFILLFESNKILVIFVVSVLLLVLVFIFSLGKEYHRIQKEVVSIVTVLAVVQSLSGSVLEEFSEIIYLSLFMSFAYPAILDTFGNYGSIIVARTSTKLNLGEIEKGSIKEVLSDVKAIVPTSILVFPFVSLIPFLLSYKVFQVVSVALIPMVVFFFSFLAMVFLFLVMSFYIAVFISKFHIDPDNGGIPLVTTIADFIATLYAVAISLVFISF
ncbi:MAG: magnesium transporter [Archaeoglobaceae archaeon]